MEKKEKKNAGGQMHAKPSILKARLNTHTHTHTNTKVFPSMANESTRGVWTTIQPHKGSRAGSCNVRPGWLATQACKWGNTWLVGGSRSLWCLCFRLGGGQPHTIGHIKFPTSPDLYSHRSLHDERRDSSHAASAPLASFCHIHLLHARGARCCSATHLFHTSQH